MNFEIWCVTLKSVTQNTKVWHQKRYTKICKYIYNLNFGSCLMSHSHLWSEVMSHFWEKVCHTCQNVIQTYVNVYIIWTFPLMIRRCPLMIRSVRKIQGCALYFPDASGAVRFKKMLSIFLESVYFVKLQKWKMWWEFWNLVCHA